MDTSQEKGSLIKEVKFINGAAVLEYEDDEYDKLVVLHQLSLIGKFSYDFSMRILKWKPRFKYEEDPLIVPIWVSLFDLPIEFMNIEVIFSMATAVGKPLKVDAPTLNMTRPCLTRFCVEVDLTKDFPKSVKVGKKSKKHDQIFTYEHIPHYCSICSKIGHKKEDCKVGIPKEVASKKGLDGVKSKGVSKVVAKNSNPKLLQPAIKPLQHVETIPSQPAMTQAATGKTGPSSSGLTPAEKSAVPMDVQSHALVEKVTNDLRKTASKEVESSIKARPLIEVNRFSVLASIIEIDDEIDSDDDDLIE
ncbi:OLC1v1031390C1 [Oldenlandia corymbosa var. corymbosa]|uniref:OLC1v1031390C1 n=1 Tax=Oldenlandia corymbosa var. corymbosa TaxID=529605 RepID=A0AAV1CJB4_OLDCO|nr:OLC1v1031390C1 [Oldenlandia corymbosa var. corymbosa]